MHCLKFDQMYHKQFFQIELYEKYSEVNVS